VPGIHYFGNDRNQLYINHDGECLVYELKRKVDNRRDVPMAAPFSSDVSGFLVDPPGLEHNSPVLHPLLSGAVAADLAALQGMQAGNCNMQGMTYPALAGMDGAQAVQLMWPQSGCGYVA
jgi:hypothetical protein